MAVCAPLFGADDLARHVPADVGLFVEARDAADLLTALTEPQLWATLAEFTGQPARPENVAVWREQIRAAVRMEPQEAIPALFGKQVAFVGAGLRRAQDGVVLCRPETAPAEWLRRWEAAPSEQSSILHKLPGNLGVAALDGLLAFGDTPADPGLLEHVLAFHANPQGPSLADSPDLQRLLARTPANAQAVLFARMPTAATTSAPATASGFAASSALLIALHRDAHLLHFTAAGDAPSAAPPALPPQRGSRLLTSLPDRTLVGWEGWVDFDQLRAGLERLPERNPLRIALKMPEQSETVTRWINALSGATAVAVGTVRATDESPALPAVALLLGTSDAQQADASFTALAESCATVYNVLCMARGVEGLPRIREIGVGRGVALQLNLTRLAAAIGVKFPGEFHLTWMVHDGDLLIATHTEWLRQLVQAREGRIEGLARVLRLPRQTITPESRNLLVIQWGAVADLGQAWLGHLEKTAPDCLHETWWRARQPQTLRLGIDVEQDAAQRRLRVLNVLPSSPAADVLRRDDVLLGVDQQRFATSQPIPEIQTALQSRAHARWVDLIIERNGTEQSVRVALPFLDPVQSLRRVVAIGRLAARTVYHEDPPSADGPRGYLTVELRTSEKPLFDPPVAQPIGENP